MEGNVTEVNPDFLKAVLLMVFTFEGKVMAVKPEQFSKALTPMEVTEAGMANPLSRMQPLKASLGMDVSWQVASKVTEVNEVQPWNALAPIEVTVLGMTMSVRLVH